MKSDAMAGPEQLDSPLGRWSGIRWKVGDICRLVNGDAFNPTDWSTSGIPIIRIQNLNDPAKPFNCWAGALDGLVIVRPGDVLLAWSGTPGTSFGIHRWKGGIGVLNQHIFRVDLDLNRVNPDWFVFAVNNALHVLIGKAHGGVGLRHVTKGEVERLELLFPPLDKQERIAKMLSGALAMADQARRAARERLAAAEALPAAYLREVFEGPEASGWAHVGLGTICDLLPSKSIVGSGGAEVRAITTACLSEGGFLAQGVKRAVMRAEDIPECRVSCGEVLVARSNTPELVGRVSVYKGDPPDVVASDLTIRLQAKAAASPDYLGAYLSYLYKRGYWTNKAGGASGSMKKITRGQLSTEVIPLPSLEIQKAVVRRLSDRACAVAELRRALESENAAIEALPAALLRQAFHGNG